MLLQQRKNVKVLGIVTIRSPWVQENANIESGSGTSNNIITEVG